MSAGTIRFFLAFLFCVFGAFFVFGVWALFPYLVEEHRRLEPWKWPLLWIGEATTLFWFSRYCYVHSVRGVPLQSRAAHPSTVNKAWLLAFVSMAAALGLALAYTFWFRVEEEELFANAVVTTGQIYQVQTDPQTNSLHFAVRCRYPDGQGDEHEAVFLVSECAEGFPRALPPETVMAIHYEKTPIAIRVSFDPTWPDRSWLTDWGPHDGHRMDALSLCLLFLQAILVFWALPFWLVSRQMGVLPWWQDVYKIMPFAAAAVLLALLGLLYQISNGVLALM